MRPKYLAAALSIALGLCMSEAVLAGEATTRPTGRKASTATSTEDLLGRTVFQVLIGEFALQRGDTQLSADAWVDLALRTRDPKAVARAIDVTTAARQFERALELTRLWLVLEPLSERARQTQASLLVLTNRLDELAPELAQLLEHDKANLASNLMHLNRMLGRIGDKKAVQRLIDRLSKPYASIPEAHFAMAQAALSTGDNGRALAETEMALGLRPDWEMAALARAQLQASDAPGQAISGLTDFVSRNPSARDARLALARLLVTDKRYDESRQQFERLLKDNPDNPEVIYPVAMLALQHGDYTLGRQQLEHLLQTDFPDKSTVHFFLGQLDQEQKKPEAALNHFQQVTAGDQFIQARGRAAQLLMELGRPQEARELLRQTRGNSPAQEAQLILAESQMLRDAKRYNDAYIALESGLTTQPDNPDLLYEAALTAERMGKPELLEAHLKQLLAHTPEHAHALNALGYSWAERNVNLAEAHDLIVKASALIPEDPFIMDSLGWVLFRQGKLEAALQTLQNAYRIKADPEIAAHLAEVLWRLNRQAEAKRLLDTAQRQNPDNEVLANVIKKLQP